MPRMRQKVAAPPTRPKAAPVPAAPAGARGRGASRNAGGGSSPGRGSRAEALEKIFETAIAQGEGFRTAALGIPRHGKTYHLQDVIDQAIARGVCDWAFVHDTKKIEAQYAGTLRENVQELSVNPIGPDDSQIVVFHPTLATVQRPEVEDIAQLALHQFGRTGHRCVLVVDELAKALKDGGKQSWSSHTTGEIIREGSSQNVSIAVTGQDPAGWPREAIAMMETYAFFRLAGRLASYVCEAFRLPPEIEEALPRLERGEFFLYTLEGCDGRIYGPR